LSEFEFQRFVTIGQYLPTGSVVHRLDPRTRLLGGLLLLLAITLTPRLSGLALGLIVVLTITVLARVPLGYALRGVVPSLPFILFLALLQVLLGPGSAETTPLFSWGPIHISVTSLISGATIPPRFGGLILLLTILSASTSTTEMVLGLERLLRPVGRLGLPIQDFVLMIQVALRFLPLLAREAERIAKSQASRGAEWGTGRGGLLRRTRQALPILVPLFLVSLQRAEALAMAMEARGYRSDGRRTSMVALNFRRGDYLALLLSLIASAVILVA